MRKYLLLVALCAVACNKLPVGEGELDQRGNFNARTIILPFYASVTETKGIPLGSSTNLILGKNADYESRVILRFVFPDTLPNGAKDIKLIMLRNPNFHRDTLRFSIHLLTTAFTETEATWTKKNADAGWTAAGGDFEIDSIRYVVYDQDSLIVNFNFAELSWIKQAKGIILVPRDTGFVAWYSREGGNAPQIRMTIGTTTTPLSIDADLSITRGPSPLYYESWLGSGAAFRNFVKFAFDTTLVTKKCLYGELTFSVAQVFALRDSLDIGVKELLKPLNGFDTDVGSLVVLKRIAATDTLVTMDIGRYIQKIIDHPDSNFGFFMFLSPDNYDIANLKVRSGSYGLKVGYIDPPGGR
jgi:hypothetical protein